MDWICCALAVAAACEERPAAAAGVSSPTGLTGSLALADGHPCPASTLMLLRRGSGSGAGPPSVGGCRLNGPSCLRRRSIAPVDNRSRIGKSGRVMPMRWALQTGRSLYTLRLLTETLCTMSMSKSRAYICREVVLTSPVKPLIMILTECPMKSESYMSARVLTK